MQVCRDFFLVLSHQFQKFFHRFGRLLFGSRIKVRMKSDFQVLLEQAKAEMENIIYQLLEKWKSDGYDI